METLIYLDSNIWIDFWEDRKDNIKPLGEFAFQLLKKTYECKYRVGVSTVVINELEFNYSKQIFMEIIKDLRNSGKYYSIKALESDKLQARRLADERETDYNDTLHAILAKRANAKYLVTRNIKDFEKLLDLAEAILPEELL